MTITIVYKDGSERQHIMWRTFDAVIQARNYAYDNTVAKVLINGRRIWA